MSDSDRVNESHGHAGAVLETLRQHRVAAIPPNFHLLYDYRTGRDAELCRAVDAALQGRQLTQAVCDSLFRKHLDRPGRTTQELLDTGTRIGDALTQISALLDTAGDDSERYGRSLEAASSGLAARDASLPGLHDLLQMVVRETRQMQDQNARLRGELSASAQEIESLRVHLQEVQREVMTDALTGIANRKFFDIHLPGLVAAAAAAGAPLSLLMMDIDRFKQFNDTYGHQVGDQVLRLVARTLTDCVKGRDLAARYGGEEFAVSLPNTGLENALVVAEQIRRSIASRRIVRRSTEEDLGGITASIGVAQLAAGDTVAALVQRADEALYAAKAAGRNCTLSERDLAPPPAAAIA